ncbi:hypothetical protein C7H19_06990 [Aphanothece hegewaldii CCALA 016]|uniref:Uncharacterized protein n=1 Tax=Aphanothece hegewaldii CCALA 016 TaxID=2107694 RepID=A0A2T1M0M9_9CHRO|nr:hypothetical protein [Aphanothece hegewaldii]PSF38211.1 hypothetical protein C7H19_06990 [Aphanothece hegewaldii CCALA 016]
MISLTVLAQISVEDFFNDSNWRGQPHQIKPFPQPAIDPTAQLWLNVEEFLKISNWQGSSILDQALPTQTKKALPLTLSVQEYLKCNGWDSKLTITKPEVMPKQPTKTARKMQVNDLTKLF